MLICRQDKICMPNGPILQLWEIAQNNHVASSQTDELP